MEGACIPPNAALFPMPFDEPKAPTTVDGVCKELPKAVAVPDAANDAAFSGVTPNVVVLDDCPKAGAFAKSFGLATLLLAAWKPNADGTFWAEVF